MSSSSRWPKPPRLEKCSDPAELTRWHLRLAIISTEGGSATALAKELGVEPNVLHLALSRGSVSHSLGILIEKLLGREHFPRELFNPEPQLPGQE